MRVAFAAAVLGGFLYVPAPQHAQPPATPSVLPPGSFSLSGKWSCNGVFRGGKPHQAAYTVDLILAGKWLELTEQDVQLATGYVAKYLIGFDPQHQRLVEFDANTFGAATYSSTTGWQQNTLTMTSSPAPNPNTPTVQAPSDQDRFVYTLTANDTFTVDWQTSKSPNPTWVTADHLSCQRQR